MDAYHKYQLPILPHVIFLCPLLVLTLAHCLRRMLYYQFHQLFARCPVGYYREGLYFTAAISSFFATRSPRSIGRIAAQFSHIVYIVSYCVYYVQKFWEPSPKKEFWGQKHAKFATHVENFTVSSRMSLVCIQIFHARPATRSSALPPALADKSPVSVGPLA